LYATNHLEWTEITRTDFQRILYFCAVLSPIANIEWGYSFSKGSYGPFNRELNEATDIIVQYNFAEVSELTLRSKSSLKATYTITQLGKDTVDTIRKLTSERKRFTWIETVIEILEIYGTKVISKLVSKEPTISEMMNENRDGVINLSLEENRSIELSNEIVSELSSKYEVKIDTIESKLISYFDYLSKEMDTPELFSG